MKRILLFLISCGLIYLAQDWAWVNYDIGDKFESFREMLLDKPRRRTGLFWLLSWVIQIFYWWVPYGLLVNVFLPKTKPVDKVEQLDLVADSERELIRLVEAKGQEGWTPFGVIARKGSKFEATVKRSTNWDQIKSEQKAEGLVDTVLKWISRM